jgi:hypothetical protein
VRSALGGMPLGESRTTHRHNAAYGMLRHLGVVGVVEPLDLGGGHDRVAEVAMPKSLSPLTEKVTP